MDFLSPGKVQLFRLGNSIRLKCVNLDIYLFISEQSVDGTDDVWFINYYSPHCSHCHDLAPTVSQLKITQVLHSLTSIPNSSAYSVESDLRCQGPVILFGHFTALYGSHSRCKNGLYFPNFMYFSTYFPYFMIYFPKCKGKGSFHKIPNNIIWDFLQFWEEALNAFQIGKISVVNP